MPPTGRPAGPGRSRRPGAPRDRTACASSALSHSWLPEQGGRRRPGAVFDGIPGVVGGRGLDDVPEDGLDGALRIAPADHRENLAMLVDLAPLIVGDVVEPAAAPHQDLE